MLVVKGLNDARMRQKLRAMTAMQRNATRDGVAAGAGEILRWLNVLSPRDTHRYVRGWQQAHQQLAAQAPAAGAAPPLSAITPSRYYTRNAARIRKQAVYWETIEVRWAGIVERYRARPGHETWKSYRSAVETLRKVEAINTRAQQQLAAVESEAGRFGVVIGGRATRRPLALGQVTRAIVAVHGGTARFLGGGSRHFVEVKNLEAHARIVGARTGVVRRCLWLAKINGVVAVRGAYARQLKQAAKALP